VPAKLTSTSSKISKLEILPPGSLPHVDTYLRELITHQYWATFGQSLPLLCQIRVELFLNWQLLEGSAQLFQDLLSGTVYRVLMRMEGVYSLDRNIETKKHLHVYAALLDATLEAAHAVNEVGAGEGVVGVPDPVVSASGLDAEEESRVQCGQVGGVFQPVNGFG
jgi:hypothetical protein